MRTLTSIEQFNELAASEPVVFMFTADWCPDCRIIEPILPEIEEAHAEFTFVSVDRDEFIDLCIEKNIYGIPSFLAYTNGAEAGRFVSKDRKTKEEIEKFLADLAR